MLLNARSASLILSAFLAFSGCDLPQGAGRADQILDGADSPEASFSVQPVTQASLPMVMSWPVQSPHATRGWIGRSRGPSGQIIAPGDKLDVSIWDNEESSLLTNPGQKVVALTGLTVSQDGSIFLPYVSEIYVANMSPDEARAAIQDRMVSIVPSVQVQLSHASGKQNSVDLVSGTNRPGIYPLIDRNTTVLSLIAEGGGVSSSIPNPQVRLMRDGTLYGVSLAQLMSNPSLDTTLRGGDKVFLESEDRFFLSMGATGVESRVPFPSDRISALDAVSMSGGMDQTRANPAAIFLLRAYSPNAVRADGKGPPKDRVIFTFDLTTADGLFSASEFQVQNRDVVIVTESPITAARTVIALLGSALAINAAAN